jgi:glycolate oxidase FAD binding subunit
VAETLEPSTIDELRRTVAAAVDVETPLEIVGAGSKREFGRPVEAGRVVRLDGLSGITLYEPAELVMSAKAGTSLAEVERQLADSGQQLAFEPPDYGAVLGGEAGRQTIGGVLACNLAGPRRIKAGAARDHFLGVQAITGRGDLIKSGGRVVKNVTGYDLCKLLAGSFGTLAVMTDLTFKVLPAPEVSLTLMLRPTDRVAGFAALRAAMASAYDVAGAAFLPESAAARSSVAEIAAGGSDLALIRIEGPEPSVRYRAGALQQLLASHGSEIREAGDVASISLWRDIRDVALLPQDTTTLWRVSVPPASGPGILQALEARLSFGWLADWAGGLLWLAAGEAEDGGAAAIRETIAASGGHATLIRGPEALRARIEVFQPQPPPLARLTARVKDSFDPKRILNPGRMYRDV